MGRGGSPSRRHRRRPADRQEHGQLARGPPEGRQAPRPGVLPADHTRKRPGRASSPGCRARLRQHPLHELEAEIDCLRPQGDRAAGEVHQLLQDWRHVPRDQARDTASLETGAGAKAANVKVDDLSDAIRSLDKKGQGDFYSLGSSLPPQRSDSSTHVAQCSPCLRWCPRPGHGRDSRKPLRFLCDVPRQPKFQVFSLWLGEDHHARLSSIFAPHLGHPVSEDLDAEYLNVFETRTGTPFFQDVYVTASASC